MLSLRTKSQIASSDAQKMWLLPQVVSSLLAGAAVGSLAGSGLADSLGRKTALLLDAVPLLIGALVSATSTSLTSMVMGRIFCGIGIGLASALVPLYISEVSSCQHGAVFDMKEFPQDNAYILVPEC